MEYRKLKRSRFTEQIGHSVRYPNLKQFAILEQVRIKIENGLYYVLDDALREDRSPARKSKNNLAMLRKYVFNILQIAKIRKGSLIVFTEMMDSFADDSNKIQF